MKSIRKKAKSERRQRFLLLAEHLAKRVGFSRLKMFGRNRVTQRGHNPIYLLAAAKCGLPIGYIHTEISQRIAPILSADCFWLWWMARRALAKRDRELRKIESRRRKREQRKFLPSNLDVESRRRKARERYQVHIVEERARARLKKARAKLKIKLTDKGNHSEWTSATESAGELNHTLPSLGC